MEKSNLNILDFIGPKPVQPVEMEGNLAGAEAPVSQLFGEMLAMFSKGEQLTLQESPIVLGSYTGDSQMIIPDGDALIPNNVNRLVGEIPSAIPKQIAEQGRAILPEDAFSTAKPPTGRFEVISVVRDGDNFLLDVISKEQPDNAVRINIPLQSLKTVQERIPVINWLTGSDQYLPEASGRLVEDYLTKLNAKEIEIVHPHTEEGPEEVVLKIFVESEGRSAIMQHKIRASLIERAPLASAKSADTGSDQGVKQVVSSNDLEYESMPHEHGNSTSARQKNASQSEILVPTGKEFESLASTRAIQNTHTNENNWLMAKTPTGQLAETEPTVEQESVKSVRIVLPESIKSGSIRNTHSIMLRIEPEHLGPARLDLQMKHDMLTARVIVESVEAKMTLESSLGSLIEQLSRAEIKVDHIEINVRGDSDLHYFSERKPQWFNANTAGRTNLDDDANALAESAPVIAYINDPMQYISNAGVNVLA